MKYIPALVATLVILIVVSIPGPKLPPAGFSGADKLAHFLFFGTWCLAVQFGFGISNRWRWILPIGIAFGLLTEVIQLFVKERSFDWFDILFDLIGLVASAGLGPTLMPMAEKIWPLSRWANK
jgi:VanZ family protein